MRFIIIYITLCLVSLNLNAELKKPNILIVPEEVVKIQLSALQNNNMPYEDAGIEQTWEFAHPSNRVFTGPLERFKSMMYSPSYSIMLDHETDEIIKVKLEANTAYFFIELTDKQGDLFGFEWILKKVTNVGIYKDCWMTTSVSQPIPIAKST